MTKEEFIDFLEMYPNPEDAIDHYIYAKAKKEPFWAISTIKTLIESLDKEITDLTLAARVSNERAFYIENFLKGKMYTSEEAAKEHLPLHIGHAEKIKDITSKWK